jgi:PPOX class probable F420-dependent enzyme
MDRREALRRLGAARVGRLATVDPGGLPHVVPFVFVVSDETIYWAVDAKPKRSADLQRLANIEANPNVQVLVDHYEDDWTALWWVRASGPARVVIDEDERHRAVSLLAEKYPQDAAKPPPGPVVAIEVTRVTWWEAAPG